MIKKEMKESGPKDVVSIVSHEVGGVVGAVASGQLPQNEMQVSNAKRSTKLHSPYGGDNLYVMMQQSKTGDSYVGDIKASPDPAIVIANNKQLDDLLRFCCTTNAGKEVSILTVDPTFAWVPLNALQLHIGICC